MLEISVLGPLRAVADGDEIFLKRRQVRAVLTKLALTPGVPVSADAVVDAVWGSRLPADARHAVHVYVARLRAAHPAIRDALVTRPGGYELSLEREHVDAAHFEDLVTAAARDEQGGADKAASALQMWQGLPLLEFAYEEFAQAPIRHLEHLRREAIFIGAAAATAGHARPADWLRVLEDELEHDPLDERLWDLLVSCYEAADRKEATRDASWRRDRALHDVLPPVRAGALHRRPVVQAIPGLVDRDRELEEIAKALTETRLLTVVGPPGSGKTRLAVHLAATADGPAALVSLADHPTVVDAICAGLGIPMAPGSPTFDSLARYTAPDTMLVVLDNCEHVATEVSAYLRAALEHSPGLTFLATSRVPLYMPDEEVYEIGGLSSVPESDLELSPAAELLSIRAASPAADPEMLNRLAGRLDGLPLAIEIVGARMSRMSAETIGSRIADPATLTATRIRGVADRHTSLGKALGSSIDLLGDDAALLFRRVSRFASPFSADDAGALTPELDQGKAREALAELVDGSLVERTEDGYRMLWVVAAFGRTLAPDDAPRDRRLHARHIEELVTVLAPQIHSSRGLTAYKALSRLSADITEAVEWAIDADPAAARRIVADLMWYWHVRGNWPDRLALVERVNGAAPSAPDVSHVRARLTEMILRFDMRDAPGAASLASDIVAESAGLRFFFGVAFAEAMISAVSSVTGERRQGVAAAGRARRALQRVNDPFARAVAWFSEAVIHLNTDTHQRGVELCRRIVESDDPDPIMWSSSAFVLARDERTRGNLQRAEDLITRAAGLLDVMQEPVFRSLTHIELAMLHRVAGRWPSAVGNLVETLDDALRRRDAIVITPSLDALALVAFDLDDAATAVTLMSAAEVKRREAPWEVNPWDFREAARLRRALAGSLGDESYRSHAQLGTTLTDAELLELVNERLAGR